MTKTLLNIFQRLQSAYGAMHKWWSESKDEIIIGAILTQNTNWNNVEKALANLRSQALLSLIALSQTKAEALAELIRPSGYHNHKSQRLIDVSTAIITYDHSLEMSVFRDFLLSLKGIGPETADSILLYAYRLPIFVIDAYTIRIFSRLGFCSETVTYHALQAWFEQYLQRDYALYSEYHALLIQHAKTSCRKRPLCLLCPLNDICYYYQTTINEQQE